MVWQTGTGQWAGSWFLTCVQFMLSWQCQWGVSCNILINRSVSQVIHNSSHKVASGWVPAKVSCPYLGCAHRYTQTHTIEGYKERWELRERGRGRGTTLQTMSGQILPLTDRHSHTDTAASVSYTCFRRKKLRLLCILLRAELAMFVILRPADGNMLVSTCSRCKGS